MDLLAITWRDLSNDPALGKAYLVDAAPDADIEDLLDELQALSDLSIKSTNKITLTAYANSVPAAAKIPANHADDKMRVQLVYRTDNPAEFVRVNVYGPKMTLPIGNDKIVDVTDSIFDGLHTQVIKTLRSNSGAVPTECASGKFLG